MPVVRDPGWIHRADPALDARGLVQSALVMVAYP